MKEYQITCPYCGETAPCTDDPNFEAKIYDHTTKFGFLCPKCKTVSPLLYDDKDGTLKLARPVIKKEEIKMNDISDINFDYKALYEELKAKMDKIEYKELKEKINDKLGLRGFITYNTYKKDERLKALSQQNYFTFLSKIYSDEQVEKVIKEIGWEKLTKIIDDVYKEVLAQETEAEEEK